MPQVAIILTKAIDVDYEYQTVTELIASSITDWTEVTDEEYKILQQAQTYDYHARFLLITRPTDESAFIKRTVADYVAWAKKLKEQQEAERLKRERAALERKLKKEAKTKADKQKLFERLKQELGEE